jgi:hypothetical protein
MHGVFRKELNTRSWTDDPSSAQFKLMQIKILVHVLVGVIDVPCEKTTFFATTTGRQE